MSAPVGSDRVLQLANVPPCQSCGGGCCTRYSIEVTVYDIERLAVALSADPAAFCGTVESWPGRCMIEPSLVDERPVNLVLRQVDRACLFFVGGPHGCSVHSARPRSCMVYPFMGSSAGLPVQRSDRICPAPWSVSRHAPETSAELARLDDEIARHNMLVCELNHLSPGANLREHLNALRAARAFRDTSPPG
jgi:Fe-S-cluster containining protein